MNWKSDLELSNINQRYKDRIRFAMETNKAKFLLLWFLFELDLVKNIKIAPTVGNKIIEDKIGKFIILKLTKLIIQRNLLAL